MKGVPELIELVCEGSDWSMKVDGQDFPIPFSVDSYGRGGPVVGPVNTQSPPTVTLAIPAHRITVVHSSRRLAGEPAQ